AVLLQPICCSEMPLLLLLFTQEGIRCISQQTARELVLTLSADSAELMLHDELIFDQVGKHLVDEPVRAVGTHHGLGSIQPELTTEDARGLEQSSFVLALLFDSGLSEKHHAVRDVFAQASVFCSEQLLTPERIALPAKDDSVQYRFGNRGAEHLFDHFGCSPTR